MGNYYEIARVARLAPEIERDPNYPATRTKDEEIVDDFGADVNEDLDNKLSPFADSLPLVGADITEAIKAAVTYEVLSQWKAYIKEYEAAKFWHNKHMEKYEFVMTRFKKTQNDGKNAAGIFVTKGNVNVVG